MCPTLGYSLDEIMNAFKRIDRELCGRRIVEAAIIGDSTRYRWQGNGKLGVVVGEIGIRDATETEYGELEEAIELGQAQFYTMPLYVFGRSMTQTVIHQATGTPLDTNSQAARKQSERWARRGGRSAS